MLSIRAGERNARWRGWSILAQNKQGWCHTAEPLGTWNLESTTSYRRAGARDSLAGVPLLSTAMHRKTRQISPLTECRGRRAGPPLVPSRRDPHLTHSITSLSTRMRSSISIRLKSLGTQNRFTSAQNIELAHMTNTREVTHGSTAAVFFLLVL
jgi:hypothetical protein